jgi:hypothetical protein
LIDGIKAKVLYLNSDVWRGCQTLEFGVFVSSRTGEVLTNRPQLAERNGLAFKIVPPINPVDAETCYLLGSLHKFKNQGLHNADDFNVNDIRNVLNDLRELHIDPSVTMLENIEFGVNILLPYSCQTVLDAMISMSNRQFVELKFNGVHNGKRLIRDRFELKIYDKGKLETGAASHLLRVELRVKKMVCLNKAVVTLSDLTDKTKLQTLGQMLVKYLQTVVMYGGNFDEIEKYPPPIDKKIWQWTNPNYWSKLTKEQRFKEQKAFDGFNESTGAAQMKADIIKAVVDKWQELLRVSPSVLPTSETVSVTFAPTFETVSDETVSVKRNGFSNVCTIKINGANVLNNKQQKQKNGENYFSVIVRQCQCCKVDISGKRPQSVFCSVGCKNRFNNSKRGAAKVSPSVSPTVEPSPMERTGAAQLPKVKRAKVERSKVVPSVSSTVEPSPMVAPKVTARDFMLEYGEDSDEVYYEKLRYWYNKKRQV